MFQLTGNSVEPTAEALTIPELEKLWNKDSSTSKAKARAAFAYIYHSSDPRSSYNNCYDRETEARADFLGGKAPTADLERALEKYKKLITTPEQRLLEGSLTMADKLAVYFSDIDFTEVDTSGKLVHDPAKAMANLQKVGTVMKSLQELRALMEKGQEEKEANRGGATMNMFDAEST